MNRMYLCFGLSSLEPTPKSEVILRAKDRSSVISPTSKVVNLQVVQEFQSSACEFKNAERMHDLTLNWNSPVDVKENEMFLAVHRGSVAIKEDVHLLAFEIIHKIESIEVGHEI